MNAERLGLLRFKEEYFARIWGGSKLHALYGKPIPLDKSIGEAWLIADHPTHESVVAEGPHQEKTLRSLIEADAGSILGTRAQLTIYGRFPLLLKILDARETLSVQVHPDDACAASLGERDIGKTEMWYVLQAYPNSELICGMDPSVTADRLEQAVGDGSIETLLTRFAVSEDASVFVPTGTVHAICGGLLLAEIQQTSDVTYRLYDWGRDDPNRPLHIPQALQAIHFGSRHEGIAQPLSYPMEGATCAVLAACRYFAAELVTINGAYTRQTRAESFHILLGRNGSLRVNDAALEPGQALLVPGCANEYTVSGGGAYLDYYVPDIERDIIVPLLNHGHARNTVALLLHL